jgi:hypothetical protein
MVAALVKQVIDLSEIKSPSLGFMLNLVGGSYLFLLAETLHRAPLFIIACSTCSPLIRFIDDLSVVFGCYIHPMLRIQGRLLDFRESRVLTAMGLRVGLSWRRHIIDYLEKVDIRINVVGGVKNVWTMTRWLSVGEDGLLRMIRFQVVMRQGFGTHGSWV